jgi:hypothetical protein
LLKYVLLNKMGNQTSGMKDVYPNIPKNLTSTNFNVDPIQVHDTLDRMKSSMLPHINFFNHASMILNSWESAQVPTDRSQINIIEQIVKLFPSSGNATTDNNNVVQFLFASGAIITTLTNDTNYTFQVNAKFKNILSRYVQTLNNIQTIETIQFVPSKEVVNDALEKKYKETLQSINNALSRIVFYKFSINFNWLIMFIFIVYIENQFEILKYSSKLTHQREDYHEISKQIDDILNKLKITANDSKSRLLNATNRISSGGYKQKGGSTTLKDLETNLTKLHHSFLESNENVEKFFNVLNTDQGIFKKIFADLIPNTNSSKSSITNQNINNAISELINKINSNPNPFTKTDITNFFDSKHISSADKTQLINQITSQLIFKNNEALSNTITQIPAPPPPPPAPAAPPAAPPTPPTPPPAPAAPPTPAPPAKPPAKPQAPQATPAAQATPTPTPPAPQNGNAKQQQTPPQAQAQANAKTTNAKTPQAQTSTTPTPPPQANASQKNASKNAKGKR